MIRAGLIALWLPAAALASEVSDAANDVAASFRNAAALAELAARDHPDPWLVTEELCRRGWFEVAAAFAGVSPHERKLAAYVTSRRGRFVEPAARRALAEAKRLRIVNRPRAALALLPERKPAARDVFAIEVEFARAKTFRELYSPAWLHPDAFYQASAEDKRYHVASERAFLRAGRWAAELGWSRRAGAALKPVVYAHCLWGHDATGGDSVTYGWKLALRADEAAVFYGIAHDQLLAIFVTPRGRRYRAFGDVDRIQELAKALARPTPLASLSFGRLQALMIDSLALGPEVRRIVLKPPDEFLNLPFVLLTGDREVVYAPRWSGHLHAKQKRLRARGEGVLAVALARGAGAEEARAVGDVVLTHDKLTAEAVQETAAQRNRWRAVHLACAPDFLIHDKRTQDWRSARFRYVPPTDLLVLSRDAERELLPDWPFPRIRFGIDEPRHFLRNTWSVTDPAATRTLLKRFYELWNAKEPLPAATALRRAQDFVRSHAKWKHPHFWAGWQLWGSPD